MLRVVYRHWGAQARDSTGLVQSYIENSGDVYAIVLDDKDKKLRKVNIDQCTGIGFRREYVIN